MSLKRVHIKMLKHMSRRLQFNRARKRWYKKIANVHRETLEVHEKIPLNPEKHIQRWQPLNPHIDTRWYETFSFISGQENIDYVPEDLYYLQIEPLLNRLQFYHAYRDKNFYDKYNEANHPGIFPETVLRNIEGVYYDQTYQPVPDAAEMLRGLKEERLVVKPSLDTGGGRNVLFFNREKDNYVNKKGETLTPRFLDKKYKHNFMIQKYIRQHDYFSRFNKASLNTIRLTTYRSVKTEEVHPLHANLRMGGKDSFVDNVASGGVFIHVNEDGRLAPYGLDAIGRKCYTPPSALDSKFSDMEPVPFFSDMKRIAREIAKNYYYFRMLGFDFCLEHDNTIRLTEINFGGLGIIIQMESGSLFKQYTGEVIDYCAKQMQGKEPCDLYDLLA